MLRVVGFTVVSYSQIDVAENLSESFKLHNPDHSFVIFVIDFPHLVWGRKTGRNTYLTFHDLDNVDVDLLQVATALGREHFVSYLRPRIAEHVASEADVLICFDPQMTVLGSIGSLSRLCAESELVVVPIRQEPVPKDNLEPSIWTVAARGMFNSGVFAFPATARTFIDWWRQGTELAKNHDFPHDLSFLDMALSLFRGTVMYDQAFLMSAWNLDEFGTLGDRDASSQWPVVINLEGFDIDNPYWVSTAMPDNFRTPLSRTAILRKIYSDYAEEIRDRINSRQEFLTRHQSDGVYSYENIVPGLPLSAGLRYVYRHALVESTNGKSSVPPTPFVHGGSRHFLEWLGQSVEIGAVFLQRFVHAILIDRPDIRDAFLNGRSFDFVGFGEWLLAHGRAEEPVSRFVDFVIPPRRHIRNEGRSDEGVDVFGSLNSEHGLGEAGRLLVTAMRATTIKTSTISFAPAGIRDNFPFIADNVSKNKMTILALNPDQVRDLWHEYGRSFRAGRYVIGQWFWELEEPPLWYRQAFEERLVNELWAPTRFIETMLNSCAYQDIVVKHVPLPFLEPTTNPEFLRSDLGLDDRFLFLFTFDFGSVMQRKNPEGVIEAFKNAFTPDDRVQLVIKTANGRSQRRQFEKLMWHRDDRSDIVILDQYLDHDTNYALMKSSDCYVSLHRSEGLGLTMAEAMLLSRPVIATGYSGNIDFMNDENSILIPWKYCEVGKGAGPYNPGARWADPDLGAASSAMRWVYENQDAAVSLGLRARESLLAGFSPEVAGARMQKRIDDLRKELK